MFTTITIDAICEIIHGENDNDTTNQIKIRNELGCRVERLKSITRVHKRATANIKIETIEINGIYETVINEKAFETLVRTVMRMVRREKKNSNDIITNLRYSGKLKEVRFKEQAIKLINEMSKKITK